MASETRIVETQTRLLHPDLPHSPRCPILTLPPEIISELFMHCMPTNETDPDNEEAIYFIDGRKAPLLLLHVCRAWRQIAASTPRLWTRFDVDLDDPLYHFSKAFTAGLERSRDCVLDVTLLSNLTKAPYLPMHTHKFKQYCHRIRRLELQMWPQDICEMQAWALDFPILEELVITNAMVGSVQHPDGDVECIDMFLRAPRLCDVELFSFHHKFNLSTVILPWEQITRFDGGPFIPLEWVKALPRMPNLIDCRIALLRNEDSELSSPPLSLARVRKLDITEDDPCSKILDYLIVPNLDTLMVGGPHNFDLELLDSFFKRCPPSLNVLTVEMGDIGDTVLPLSSNFTSLNISELEILGPEKTFLCSFLDAFAADPAFLPKLVELSFYFRDPHRDPSALDAVKTSGTPINQRRRMVMNGNARLRIFAIVSEDEKFDVPEEDLFVYRELQRGGMEIHIGTEKESII